MSSLVEVELSRMTLDPSNEQNLLFLKVCGSERTFRILIGSFEAFEIRRKVCSEPVKRPMPHDLIGRILEATDHTLDRVVITDLHQDTFYACLQLLGSNGEIQSVDCRPSDGIALAMQMKAKIFVSDEVLDEVGAD